jgi:hypothetical protein
MRYKLDWFPGLPKSIQIGHFYQVLGCVEVWYSSHVLIQECLCSPALLMTACISYHNISIHVFVIDL